MGNTNGKRSRNVPPSLRRTKSGLSANDNRKLTAHFFLFLISLNYVVAYLNKVNVQRNNV